MTFLRQCPARSPGCNPKVTNNPQLVNEDPYGEGWFSAIALANPGELNDLLTPEQYRIHCGSGQ